MPIRYLVMMGVSGSGKSTVARQAAALLDWPFVEGDDLHPEANVDKMRRGIALDDADRAPWLMAVAQTLRRWRAEGTPGVISCSALRRRYRDRIVEGHADVLLVHLHGSRQLIAHRLAARRGHFMPAGLLDSQFETLEPPQVPPEHALVLDIEQPARALAEAVVRRVTG